MESVMRTTHHILEIVASRGRRGLPINKVLRLICNQNVLLTAYGNIASKAGATTPGIDPQDTADVMSIEEGSTSQMGGYAKRNQSIMLCITA
jgi:hypothetical protein